MHARTNHLVMVSYPSLLTFLVMSDTSCRSGYEWYVYTVLGYAGSADQRGGAGDDDRVQRKSASTKGGMEVLGKVREEKYNNHGEAPIRVLRSDTDG